MRILANDNVPGPVVVALRHRGHDVVCVKEEIVSRRIGASVVTNNLKDFMRIQEYVDVKIFSG